MSQIKLQMNRIFYMDLKECFHKCNELKVLKGSYLKNGAKEKSYKRCQNDKEFIKIELEEKNWMNVWTNEPKHSKNNWFSLSTLFRSAKCWMCCVNTVCQSSQFYFFFSKTSRKRHLHRISHWNDVYRSKQYLLEVGKIGGKVQMLEKKRIIKIEGKRYRMKAQKWLKMRKK